VLRALGELGALKGGGAMASYLLFEPGFVRALIELGERDAHARREELLAFFSAATA
jgi:NTE family protein